jgi:hypothetical protein
MTATHSRWYQVPRVPVCAFPSSNEIDWLRQVLSNALGHKKSKRWSKQVCVSLLGMSSICHCAYSNIMDERSEISVVRASSRLRTPLLRSWSQNPFVLQFLFTTAYVSLRTTARFSIQIAQSDMPTIRKLSSPATLHRRPSRPRYGWPFG